MKTLNQELAMLYNKLELLGLKSIIAVKKKEKLTRKQEPLKKSGVPSAFFELEVNLKYDKQVDLNIFQELYNIYETKIYKIDKKIKKQNKKIQKIKNKINYINNITDEKGDL
tara:strand:- start:734 stop:1069 length:336 start_codon:yes stop_codon:yes gene_type:complete